MESLPPRVLDNEDTIAALQRELAHIRAALLALESRSQQQLERVAPTYRDSARNLLHFIALHRRHHRGLADQLHELGLSSLAGSDPHVLASLDAVMAALDAIAGRHERRRAPRPPGNRMVSHCRLLFGGAGPEPGIMVTLPGGAALDSESNGLIAQLLTAGMTLARINCAHDDAGIWGELAARVRRLSEQMGRPCRIAVDLAGPKLRTGPLPPLDGVVRVRPRRDRLGRLLAPASVLAYSNLAACAAQPGAVMLPVRPQCWQQVETGTVFVGMDASGRRRRLRVEGVEAWGLRLRIEQGCRFTAGLVFRASSGQRLEIADLPKEPGALSLAPGDRLWLVGDAAADGPLLQPAGANEIPVISCSLPHVLGQIGPGERVIFDDGKLATVVVEPGASRLLLEVTAAQGGRARLRGHKGINLPDSNVEIPALTARDIDDLAFAVRVADIINFSFVHRASDIAILHRELHRLGRDDLAVVLKIETRQAYEHLAELLLEAMRYPAPLGVMIARGDLAVQCGWESLAQIQHDILRLCAAAHVPCIWATQVLDELARHGLPTRAEITDAAMGAQADALMLNKGPNITAAVRALREIARRSHKASRSDRLVSCLAYRSNCPEPGSSADASTTASSD
jgi:pyruvate kinase